MKAQRLKIQALILFRSGAAWLRLGFRQAQLSSSGTAVLVFAADVFRLWCRFWSFNAPRL